MKSLKFNKFTAVSSLYVNDDYIDNGCFKKPYGYGRILRCYFNCTVSVKQTASTKDTIVMS